MDNIVIVGSSGHAKVLADIAGQQGRYGVVGFLDPFRAVGEQTLGRPVLGTEADLPALVERHAIRAVVVAIGDNASRAAVVARIHAACPALPFATLVHPRAAIAASATIGEGTVVMAGAVVGPDTRVGSHCILNTNCSLDHDSVLGDYASLAPRAVTGGGCRIGEGAAVGIGAVLVHGVQVGRHAVIGASALVLRDVEPLVVAHGVPARVVRARSPGDRYL